MRFADAIPGDASEPLPLPERALSDIYTHASASSDDDNEWVVPVRWIRTVDESTAYWEKGLFANQNSACKPRQEFTLDRLMQHFGVHDD